MAGLAFLVGAAVLAPGAAARAVPDAIGLGLAAQCRPVLDASDVSPVSLAVSATRAFRVALKNFGWAVHFNIGGWTPVGQHFSVHLVRLGQPATECGYVDFHPVGIGAVMWLVVVQDATIPLLGPRVPGKPVADLSPLAIFVRTDEPVFWRAMTF